MGWFRMQDSVGGTPTDAVETTALPKSKIKGVIHNFVLSWGMTASD